MKVLILIESFLPGLAGGGPVRAAANLLDQLGHRIEFRILTRHHDYLNPEPYDSVPEGCWTDRSGAKVVYLADENWFSFFRTVVESWQPDWIYLNGLFAPMTRHVLRRGAAGVPLIVAPHGNLGPGAMRRGAFKKRLWLSYAKRSSPLRTVRWHAGSSREADQIRRHIGNNAEIVTVPMAPAAGVATLPPLEHDSAKLRLVYFGRQSPEKNLPFAFARLLEFAARKPSCRIEYDIFALDDGPCELPEALPANLKINIQPALPADRLREQLLKGDYAAMLLPSLSENFSYTVFESLQAGVPVLISDQTPWRGLNEEGIGWDLPLPRTEPWLAALDELAHQDPAESARRRAQAHAYAGRWTADYRKSAASLFAAATP